MRTSRCPGEWPWYSRGPPVDSYWRYRDAGGPQQSNSSRTLLKLLQPPASMCWEMWPKPRFTKKLVQHLYFFFLTGNPAYRWPNIHSYPVFWQDSSDMLYLKVKIDGLPIPKGRLVKVKGPYYEPICRDCAIYLKQVLQVCRRWYELQAYGCFQK